MRPAIRCEKEQIHYDADQTRAAVDHAKALYTPEFLRRTR